VNAGRRDLGDGGEGVRLELVSELVQPLLEEAALRLRTDELSARLYREGVGYTIQRSGEESDAC
jgi:hypothetical protein